MLWYSIDKVCVLQALIQTRCLGRSICLVHVKQAANSYLIFISFSFYLFYPWQPLSHRIDSQGAMLSKQIEKISYKANMTQFGVQSELRFAQIQAILSRMGNSRPLTDVNIRCKYLLNIYSLVDAVSERFVHSYVYFLFWIIVLLITPNQNTHRYGRTNYIYYSINKITKYFPFESKVIILGTMWDEQLAFACVIV